MKIAPNLSVFSVFAGHGFAGIEHVFGLIIGWGDFEGGTGGILKTLNVGACGGRGEEGRGDGGRCCCGGVGSRNTGGDNDTLVLGVAGRE